MARLRCDKPYNVDEARKQKGLPRRKRANPKTTCYELAIRVPSEYQAVMGQKKVTKTVYALNKKDDLRIQVRDFEDEREARSPSRQGTDKNRSPIILYRRKPTRRLHRSLC